MSNLQFVRAGSHLNLMLFPEFNKEKSLDDRFLGGFFGGGLSFFFVCFLFFGFFFLFFFKHCKYRLNTAKPICGDMGSGRVIHQKLTSVKGGPVLSTATAVNRKEKVSIWVI